MSAYTHVNLSGTFFLEVPELNFFQILRQNVEGRREVYSNVEIGEQDEDLFAPPAGVDVVRSTRLGGIKFGRTEEDARHFEEMIKRQQQP